MSEMISRTKIIEHYKQHFMFPDNETLSEDYMIDIDWAESLISDLVEKQANGVQSEDGKLPIPLVVKSLPIKKYEIDFDGNVLAGIEISENTPKVFGAMNGYGNCISIENIKITEK